MSKRYEGVKFNAKSGMWDARWRVAPGPTGIRTKRSFPTQLAAKRYRDEQVGALATGRAVDPRRSATTVDAVAARYHDECTAKGLAPTTIDNYWRWYAFNLKPTFGHLRLSDVKVTTVRAWVAGHLATRTPETTAQHLGLLRRILDVAVTDGDAVANVARLTHVKRSPAPDAITALEPDVIGRLYEATHERYHVALTLALGAGLRSGELRGLTVDRVDFLRRTITVERQLLAYPRGHVFGADEWHHGQHAFAPTKRRRTRVVPVGDDVITALAHHLERFGAGPHGLIVTTATGRPCTSVRWAQLWRATRKRAGMPVGSGDDPGGVHQLRHAYASWLLSPEVGESVANVQAWLGHANASTTWNAYVHRTPTDGGAASDAVMRRLRAYGSPVIASARKPRAQRPATG